MAEQPPAQPESRPELLASPAAPAPAPPSAPVPVSAPVSTAPTSAQAPASTPPSTATPTPAPASQPPPPAPKIVSDIPRSQPEAPQGQNQQYSLDNIIHHQPGAPNPGPAPPGTKFTIYTPNAPQAYPPHPQASLSRNQAVAQPQARLQAAPPGTQAHGYPQQQPPPPPQGQWRPPPNIDHNAAMRRPVIVDPPKRPRNDPAVDGFASPDHDHARENPRFLEDHYRLAYAIDQSLPSAVRRVIRDNWEKCLLGSEFHQAFVTNATIHHVTPPIFQRAVRDFGGKMVNYGKNEIIQHFSMYDLDDVADLILSKASNNFLDKAMGLRLRSIEAKPLINALARAERLGYEPSDVVEEAPASNNSVYPHERVVPAQHQPYQVPPGRPSAGPPAAPITPSAAAKSPYVPGPAPQPAAGGVKPCEMCGRAFPAVSARDHHIKKQVCNRVPKTPGGFKFTCQHCGQGFSTIVGLQYHTANKVCGDFGENPKEVGTRSNPVAIPSGNNTPVHVREDVPLQVSIGSTPGYKEWSQRQRAADKGYMTPGPPSSQPSYEARAVTPSSTPGGTPGDPYAHLNPTQMAAMHEELRQAEIKYGDRLRQAQAIVDEAERKTRIDALGNSYGTKQSMIRKKYGVRLRTRRTKAEIEAEKDRIASIKDSSPSRAAVPLQKTDVVAGEKRRESGWTAANIGAAANDYGNGHDAKRQRVVAQEALQLNNNNNQATPGSDTNMTDALPRNPGSGSSARNSASLPARSIPGTPTRGTKSVTPSAVVKSEDSTGNPPERATSTATAEPAPGNGGDGDGGDSSDSDSNDSIPAALPLSVRQSLPPQPPPRSGSRTGSLPSSRPGSSSVRPNP